MGVTSGTKCKSQADPQEVASLTLLSLSRHVPPAVPGVFFLSGGQSEEMATDNLMAINKTAGVPRPWMTSFCYGRALQDSCRSVGYGQCGLSLDHVGDGQVCLVGEEREY